MLDQVIQGLNKDIVKHIPYSFDFVHLVEQSIVIDLYLPARSVVQQTTIDKRNTMRRVWELVACGRACGGGFEAIFMR